MASRYWGGERLIYLITGLMASGKSTVAELLSTHFDLSVHLHGDIFRKMITSGRVDMSAHPSEEALTQLTLRYRLTAITAKEYNGYGFTTIVQDNYYGDMLTVMLRLLEPAEVRPFVLCPRLDVLRTRLDERVKGGYESFDMEALYHEFTKATPRIGVWIDNSDETPEQTVFRILSA